LMLLLNKTKYFKERAAISGSLDASTSHHVARLLEGTIHTDNN